MQGAGVHVVVESLYMSTTFLATSATAAESASVFLGWLVALYR